MLEQCHILVETQASAQSPFKKVNYTNSSQKNKQKKNPSFSSLVQYFGNLHFSSSIRNLGNDLPHGLPNDLRLGILGN